MNELKIRMFTAANGELNGLADITSDTLPFLYARDMTHHGFQPPFEVSEADEKRMVEQFSKLFVAQAELFDLFRQAEKKAVQAIIRTKGHDAAKADYFERHLSADFKRLKEELAKSEAKTGNQQRAKKSLEKEEERLLAAYKELLRA